jgi:ATP-dependent DNA ligase
MYMLLSASNGRRKRLMGCSVESRPASVSADKVSLERAFLVFRMYFNGHDLRARAFDERREMLVHVLDDAPPGIRLSEEIAAEGPALLEQACAMGLEAAAGRLPRPRRASRPRRG